MMGCTHKVVSVSTSTLFLNFSTFDSSFNFFIILGVAAITSSLPDLDIKLGKPHRQFSHSILCLFLLSLLPFIIYRPIGIGFFIGYGTHILADSFTRMGVPALYPYKKMFGLRKISTGSTSDWTIFWLCMGYLLTKIYPQ